MTKTESAPPAFKITANFDSSEQLGLLKFSLGRQLSSTPGHGGSFGSATVNQLKQLGLARARAWIEFKQAYDLDKKQPNYSAFHLYLDQWSKLSDRLLVNWRTNYDLIGDFDKDTLLEAQIEMLAHYKTRYPNFEWIEVENEPGDMAVYYPKYQFATRMVNAVNARSLPGPALSIGGPTINDFNEKSLAAFFDLYTKDTTPFKRLDFVAYHQYLFGTADDPYANKNFPAKVAHERERLEALLAERGLNKSIPAFVSETGIFPGDRQSELGYDADLHIHAAGIAAMDYFYVAQSRLVPFHWTVEHPDNGRKNVFINAREGVPRPFYLLSRLQTMLPAMRYTCNHSMNERGVGIGSIAAGNATKVAVLTWNYQWTHGTTHTMDLVIKNLPAVFQRYNVRVQRYLIGANQHDVTFPEIKVEDRQYGAFVSGAYANQFTHYPNDIRMIVITALVPLHRRCWEYVCSTWNKVLQRLGQTS